MNWGGGNKSDCIAPAIQDKEILPTISVPKFDPKAFFGLVSSALEITVKEVTL